MVLAGYGFFLDDIVNDYARHVAWVWKLRWLHVASKLKQGVDSGRVSPESWRSEYAFVEIVNTAHHKLYVDSNNALVSDLIFAGIWYTYDWTPEDVVRLPGCLSLISLSHRDMIASLSIQSPTWERLALSLARRKSSDSAPGTYVGGTSSQKRGVSGYILRWQSLLEKCHRR